jgi:hypothetical protein
MLWHKEFFCLRLSITVYFMLLYCVGNVTKIQRSPDLILYGAKQSFVCRCKLCSFE